MKRSIAYTMTMLAVALLCGAIVQGQSPASRPTTQPVRGPKLVPDPKGVGGETNSVVQVANLIYAGTKSSKCFSDHFLLKAEQDSTISTSRRFHSVKLSSDELFDYPLVIMTGEGAFELLDTGKICASMSNAAAS
jgi:hypothetical protein